MSAWSRIRDTLRTPIGRVGLGSFALATGAVALWPAPDAVFDPAKALTFVAAVAVWLFAELFPDQSAGARAETSELAAHDQELASRIHAIATDDHVRFLKEHDFGGSWIKRDLDPVYELANFTRNATAEFNDPEIQEMFAGLGKTVRRFANTMSLGAWPFGVAQSHETQAFSMIPDNERGSDEWSERTNTRVREANELATDLASQTAQFYRLLRKKGANLLRNSGNS